MVWILPSISNSPVFFAPKPFGTVPSSPTTISITVNFMFHIFSTPWKDPRILLSFCFLSFLYCGSQEQKNLLNDKMFIDIIIVLTKCLLISLLFIDIIIVISFPCKVFTSSLARDPSLESEWQQVFSGFSESSLFSSWSL